MLDRRVIGASWEYRAEIASTSAIACDENAVCATGLLPTLPACGLLGQDRPEASS